MPDLLDNINDDHIDDHVDDEISTCLNLKQPKSFFLFAGAGSGKTRSLVKALDKFCKEQGNELRIKGKKVAVITYTNAACEEIIRRLNFNPLLDVSTIHSFVWKLIQGYNLDIKVWMKKQLEIDIAELEIAQVKGRAGKASTDRARSIISKKKKLEILPTIKQFVYNPNGNNKGKASLNHADVIKIAAEFITTKPLMRSLLISKYPILLIDESQDTNKLLMEAILSVQLINSKSFTIGLLGDTMQRIYADGKVDLGKDLPPDWSMPVKIMNHRCPKRVITLINKISSAAGGQQQKSRSDKNDGYVRLFVVNNDVVDKLITEKAVSQKMSEVTGDPLWIEDNAINKTLILEHHMAATRMGFELMFDPLYKLGDAIRTNLLDGTLPALKLFWDQVLPVVKAFSKNNNFAIATLIRKHSPLLNKESFSAIKEDQTVLLKTANEAVIDLLKLWDDNNDPTFLEVLLKIEKTSLFEIPDTLKIIASRNKEEQLEAEEEDKANLGKAIEDEEEDESASNDEDLIFAFDSFLRTPFSQIEKYRSYILGEADFDTHQGVKGLEFPRVKVIIDDTDARGFMFSYDKLFGIKAKTGADIKNEEEKKDTSNDRTRRLLYVTCSRAEESLAIVTYSSNPQLLAKNLLDEGWFEDNEIVFI